jgi:hypothetical protein
MHLDVHIQMGNCSEFIDRDGNRRGVSIIITPLKIRLNESEDKAQIVTGCNLYASCHNGDCFYSKYSKTKKEG